MNRIIFNFLLIAFGCFFSVSCDEDNAGEDKVILPTSLEFTVEVADDGSGKVSVSASADKALFYNIYFFGGQDGEQPIRTQSGDTTFTYTASGKYDIKVQAHSGISTYISATKSVDVTVDIIDPNSGYTSPETYPNMALVWQDEFNGTALNESDWTYEIGRGSNGWGNNELQYYRKENTSVLNGYLTITAKKESFEGAQYTSSRLVTKGKEFFTYGRIDIRAKLPKGQGIWPALWMLGENINSVGWPACGEIDIMELVGGAGDNKVHGTLHWADVNGNRACTCEHPGYRLPSGIFNDQFHVFSITWDSQAIKWYLDDNTTPFNTISIIPTELSEFHKNFFFIFNLAVGGNWPGNPDENTVFPQQLIVDYVRVFQPE